MALLIREQNVVLIRGLYMEQRVEQKVKYRTAKNRLNILAVLLITSFGLVAPVNSCDRWLKTDVLQADHRTPEFVKRDQYRHPLKTLKFFEVKPEMTVVEIWPGKGWYTEVLAPYITKGKLYTAHFPTDVGVDYYDTNHALFVKKLEADPNVYSQVQMAAFDPKRNQLTVPDGSADRVLTFRNVHNWLRSESEAAAFELFYKALGKFKLGNTEAYDVAFNKGTDARFCKEYQIFKNTPDGIFVDKLSGAPLFDTRDRFVSRSGWLSFTAPVPNSTYELPDNSYGMKRTEVKSVSSNIHLGHVFDDGPNGMPRYCINATVLEFIAREDIKNS